MQLSRLICRGIVGTILRTTLGALIIGAITVVGDPLPNSVVDSAATPSTQPAQGPAKLLLLPFTPIEPSDQREWIWRGVLSSLQSDLSRMPGILPITLDTTKPGNAPSQNGYDTQTALQLGQSVDAHFVIFGTYQTVELDLRLVAVILDTRTGEPIGGMKVTGSVRDIFGMEDSLSMQAKRQLPQPVGVAQAPSTATGPLQPQTNLNGPVLAPLSPPPMVFDDDAAARAIERLRNSEDSQDYFPPPPFFGFGPFIYGGLYPIWGSNFHEHHYHHSGDSHGGDPRPAQPVTTGTLSPFRGGVYLEPTSHHGTASGWTSSGGAIAGSSGNHGGGESTGRGSQSTSGGVVVHPGRPAPNNSSSGTTGTLSPAR